MFDVCIEALVSDPCFPTTSTLSIQLFTEPLDKQSRETRNLLLRILEGTLEIFYRMAFTLSKAQAMKLQSERKGREG